MGFVSRSLLVLVALYGLVFAIGDAYLLHGQASIGWGIAFVVVLVGVQYLLSPKITEWLFTIYWDEDAVPARQRACVERICAAKSLPIPRLGLIESGTPNAFAFGRLQRDARIVVTRGLLDGLTEEEIEAVLAHEIGHIAHYDFAVMALAAVAPLLLWQVYVWTNRVNNMRVVSYAAYLAYWVGQFLVLLLNRTREYGADHFSAETTGQPNHLSSALVKIGYGMMRERSEAARLSKEGNKYEKANAKRTRQLGQSLGLMGIASMMNGDAMALANDTAMRERVMRWDVINPWARVYEMSSTHPLTAFRVRALGQMAQAKGQAPASGLLEGERLSWVGFPVEFFFWAAPWVCGFLLFSLFWLDKPLSRAGVAIPHDTVAWLLLALGATWAARIAFRYQGRVERRTVVELLENMQISQMRPQAVELEGEIIGHGIPGAFWSPDLVLQDETGMMFLLYRSSVPFGRLFFAMNSADRLVGERVKVRGWCRRGLKPYVEMSRIEARVMKAQSAGGMTQLFGGDAGSANEYEDIVERSYSRWIQLATAAVCSAAGAILLMHGLR
ncbi:M48 family metalloprotease [Silvibacterium sp.]|uniref:M48 family metalloprotease n=1 Tax=Silvibacterium sp. TaxID=1964179 RepID=UPI0039E61390